jgi:hypothetical protein
METLVQQLALVSESALTNAGDVQRVAAALQKQATRDLGPIWGITATVDAFEKLEDVPIGYWPMIIRDDIGFDAAGIHLDNDRQPFALISASTSLDTWSLTSSHEALEMLVDPFGDRLIAGDSPKDDQGRVSFLVEVCDPSEAEDFAYSANGILVSDFYTPNFFDPVAAPGVRYSFTGAITEPRQVLAGGYLSWVDPADGNWWQETWFGGQASTFRNLGPLDQGAGSLRAQIDRITGQETAAVLSKGRKIATAAGLTAAVVHKASTAKADMWHRQIAALASRSTVPARSAKGSTSTRRAPRVKSRFDS